MWFYYVDTGGQKAIQVQTLDTLPEEIVRCDWELPLEEEQEKGGEAYAQQTRAG